MNTFLWYDLETFGLNPSYDRIAQFAARRTDEDLNYIGDAEIFYCRISSDYLPDYRSCLVTKITPQLVKSKGLRECDFITKINNMMKVPQTCTCGFNNIMFDDEFIRNTLYRNLLDPYEREYKEGRSRWDIIDLVRAAHDLRPHGIQWPSHNDKGNPVFKLTELTSANNIDQEGAHDAMVDVNATIAVARLIKEKQPKLFNHYLKLRNKITVKNYLKLNHIPQPLLHTSKFFTNPNGCTSLIVPLTPCIEQDNNIICFDLRQDPSPLFDLQSEKIFNIQGIFKLAINKCPFISTVKSLDENGYKRLGIDYNKCIERYELIIKNRNSFIDKLRQQENEFKKENDFKAIDDTDFQIYSSFFPDSDKKLFTLIREAPVNQKLSMNLHFTDQRCNTMIRRYVCRNYPESLDKEQLQQWKDFSISRILCPPEGFANNLHYWSRKIREVLQEENLTNDKKEILFKLLDYEKALKKYLNIPQES